MKNTTNIFATDKNVTDDFLYINSCGTLILNDRDYPIFYPEGRKDYLLMYVAKGKGYLIQDGNEIEVNEKEFFLFKPFTQIKYCFYKKDNTIQYWAHFNGTECEKILKSLNLDNTNIIRSNFSSMMIDELFLKMCNEFNSKKPFYNQICAGMLINILGLSSRSITNNITITNANAMVERVKSIIHTEGPNKLIIKDIAKNHSVTPSHLIKIFKKATGITPMQYAINFRMKKAEELLIANDYTAVEIAELTGYENYSYFSRAFKKYSGMCPQEFRKKHKE